MVLKTTFGQSQRWSLIRGTLGVENEEKNNLNVANKVLNRCPNFRWPWSEDCISRFTSLMRSRE